MESLWVSWKSSNHTKLCLRDYWINSSLLKCPFINYCWDWALLIFENRQFIYVFETVWNFGFIWIEYENKICCSFRSKSCPQVSQSFWYPICSSIITLSWVIQFNVTLPPYSKNMVIQTAEHKYPLYAEKCSIFLM